jgi:phage portal protein BeeE
MVGVAVEGSSLTYSNREQDEILFQTRALLPWAVRFEQHMSRLLPGKQFVRFNMDAAVRVDLTTRYQAHATGIGAKFLTVDEARQLEDRPPLTPAQKDELAPPAPAAEDQAPPKLRVIRDDSGRAVGMEMA